MNVFSFRRRRAFTLIELLIVIAIIALLVGILLPVLAEARKSSRKSICYSNLHQFGLALQGYSTDFRDNLASFTWRRGATYSVRDLANDAEDTYTFPAAATDIQAAAQQAIAVFRYRADRLDINATTFPNWIPHILYSHLVLNDYLQQRLPERMVACPDDRNLLDWQDGVQANPAMPDQGFFALSNRPGAGSTDAQLKRWPYSSSYTLPPSFYSPDKTVGARGAISQGPAHNTYNIPTTADLGRRKYTEVTFPQNKAMMFDRHGNHAKRRLFYAYAEVVQPILFVDSSVNDRSSRDCNDGWNPAVGTRARTSITYTPDTNWEPPTTSGAASQIVPGNQQWTQLGLYGADWGLEEAF